MAYDDEEDDLFAEEFDFVDDDDSDIVDSDLETAEAEVDDSSPAPPAKKSAKSRGAAKKAPQKTAGRGQSQRSAKSTPRSQPTSADSESTADEPAAQQPAAEPEGPPPTPTDHVVHLYEFGTFYRTIQREFTEQDAVAFAEEFNRTSKSYSRAAVAASKDDELDETL